MSRVSSATTRTAGWVPNCFRARRLSSMPIGPQPGCKQKDPNVQMAQMLYPMQLLPFCLPLPTRSLDSFPLYPTFTSTVLIGAPTEFAGIYSISDRNCMIAAYL